MEIRKAMTAPVRTMCSTDTIADAARLMAKFDVGALPVLEAEALVGIITDRDIVMRALAAGVAPTLPVARVMSRNVATCREDACIDDVLEEMVSHAVRRMPVRSLENKLVGIITLADLAQIDWDKGQVGSSLADICRREQLTSPNPAAA